MQLKGKKVLVTGADGFIGSHLTEVLLNRGCDVRAFVYYNSFNSWGWLDTLPPEKARALDATADRGESLSQQRWRRARYGH